MKPRKLLPVASAACVLALLAVGSAAAHAAGWSGWARCEISTTGPGYQQKDTHTWFVTGATGNTTATLGPGNWHVAGKGNLSQGNPAQTSQRAEWAINGTSTGGKFGVVPIAAGVVAIRPFHSQLKMSGGVAGYVQQTISNNPRTPTAISSTAWEWQFPTVQGSSANQTITGTSSANHPGIGWGTMQVSGSTVSSSCTWSFANGSIPAPPPAVPPEPVPVPGSMTPPPSPPPADPCNPPIRISGAVQIAGLVPRSFKQGERVTVCGSQLSKAALEDRYADSATTPSLGSPNTATFVLIGQRSLMVLDPVISRRGDRMVFTAGGLYERSELTRDYDVLTPVTPVPQRWSGELVLRVQGEGGFVRGPEVRWSAK